MKRSKSPRVALSALALCLAASAAMLVSPAASGQKGGRAAEEIGQVLESFDQLALDPAEVLRAARETGSVSLQTSRGTFNLRVEPFDVRADNYRAVAVFEGGVVKELPRAASRAWRGTVEGMPEARVRLVLDGESFVGIIVTPGETFYVEPARGISSAAAADDFVFYSESSLKDKEVGECGTTIAEKVGSEVERAGAGAAAKGITPGELFAPEAVADVATEADFEYYQTTNNEAATNADIADIITLADGIYDAQIGVRLNLVFQRVWTTSNDPYSATAASAALEELQTKYDASFTPPSVSPARDLVHMFTGRALGPSSGGGGNVIGIAYTGAACESPTYGFGISRSKFNGAATVKVERVALTAHEIGHNFGAVHTNLLQSISPLPPNCSPSIMNSSVQPTSNFCQFSRDQITAHVLAFGEGCLTRPSQGCTYSLASDSAYVSAAGGEVGVGVAAGAGCPWDAAETATWLTPGTPGTGTGTVNFTVAPNAGGPRATVVDIGGQRLTVKQGASAACLAAATQIAFNQTLGGSLADSDCAAVAPAGEPERTSAFADLYVFAARAGQRVRIEMSEADSSGLDTFLYLFGPDGSVVAANDDIVLAENTNSRIPGPGTAFFTLPATGVYTIEATSFSNAETGSYTLRLSDNSATNSVSLSSAAYAVDEGAGGTGQSSDGAGFRVVTVTRTGTTAEINAGTATVDYATSDGTASKQKDYAQTLGTLVFAPGETSKAFTVFVVDDAFAEAPETVTLTLSNPVGTALGATGTATLTINSSDATSGPSPAYINGTIDDLNVPFFVRQQYLDFLNREPDQSGFAFWTNEISQCGGTPGCSQVKAINVSAAFFLSIEFQNTGYLVYRTYKAAYGDATSPNVAGTVPVIRLNEFLPDTQRIGRNVVVGAPNWEQTLEANKQAYAVEFVLRPRFLTEYPLSMTPAQFVDKLVQNAGITLSAGERDALAGQLNATADLAAARAAVLRAVAENPQLRDNEFRRAFVLMQYYGYLRRNPDDPQDTDFRGWKFWLDKLNEFNGNYVQAEMVKAFLTSTEYIDRFGTRP